MSQAVNQYSPFNFDLFFPVITLVVSCVYLYAVQSVNDRKVFGAFNFFLIFLFLFRIKQKRSLIMLPALIWYLAFAVVSLFYLIVSMVITFYNLVTGDRSIDWLWLIYEFSWLVSVGRQSSSRILMNCTICTEKCFSKLLLASLLLSLQ